MKTGVSCVKPEELSAFIDFQEPPPVLIVDSEIQTAIGDARPGCKCQHGFFNFRRRNDGLYFHQAMRGFLAPVERAFGAVEEIGIHCFKGALDWRKEATHGLV